MTRPNTEELEPRDSPRRDIIAYTVNPEFYLDVAQDPIFLVGFTGLLMLYGVGVYIIRRLVDLKI